MARCLAVTGLLALGARPACVCGHAGPPPQAGKDFGALADVPPDPAGCLAAIRARLEHRASPADPALVAGAPGRRVVVASWGPRGEPVVATAAGASLAESLSAAADALGQGAADVGQGRLELDVPTALEGTDLGEDQDEPITAIGTRGILVTRDDGKTGVVLPGEIVHKHLFRDGRTAGLDRGKVRSLLAARAGVSESELDAMRAYRFRADVHVESAGRASVLPVFRGMVVHPAEATPARLVEAVRHGADYLVRSMNAEGRYVYLYHPTEDRDDGQYGILRHAGTTYAVLEAYEELGTASYLEKATLALGYLEKHLHDDPASGGKYAFDGNDEEQQKVGGAGLSLLAYAKHAATTGRRDHLELMRAFARYIIKQQYADGHFRCNADVAAETHQKLPKEPYYYPGEATLALLRLYAIDPQQAYLDAARKSADWVVHTRDALVSEDNQEHDHWMSYALNELYRLTRDETYVEHAYRIARAILKKEHGADAPEPDLVATFYTGQSTLASTRVEAFDADIALSRFAGKPDGWLVGPARDVSAWILGQQYDDDDDYWLPNRAKVVGGVRESLLVPDVEIDFVQHAMSAWLHLARLLRDPAHGKTGVPSQDPVH